MSTEPRDPFFIVGLPRSGTTWLSTALTCGPVSCLHEAIRGCVSFEQYVERLESQRAWALVIGEASPTLPFYARQVADRWPNSRYVFVWRDAGDAGRAYIRAFGDVMDPQQMAANWPMLVEFRNAMREALAVHHVLDLRFDEVFTSNGVMRIWRHVAGEHMAAFPSVRVRQLLEQRILVDPALVKDAAKGVTFPPPDGEPPAEIPVQSEEAGCPVQAAYVETVRTLCEDNAAAWDWFADVIAYVKLWDHLHDGDAIDRGYGLQALENVLLRWPENPFWREHQDALASALRESVALWQDGNATEDVAAQFEGYRLIPLAMAKALGRPISPDHLDSLIAGLLEAEPRLHPQPQLQPV